MKRILCTAAALSVLAVPAPAHAKELAAATVCGPSGCSTVAHPEALMPLMQGTPPVPPGLIRAHPFYRLRFAIDEGTTRGRIHLLVMPRSGYVRGPDGAWRHADTRAVEEVESLAGGLKPFPAAALNGLEQPGQRSDRQAPSAAAVTRSAGHGVPVLWLVVVSLGGLAIIGAVLAVRRSRSRRSSVRGADHPSLPVR